MTELHKTCSYIGPNLPSKSLVLSLHSGVFHGLLQEPQGSTDTKEANR